MPPDGRMHLHLPQLPDVVLQNIAARLDPRSLCSLDSSCRCFHSLVSSLWPQLHTLRFLDPPLSYAHLEKYLGRNVSILALAVDCSKLDGEDELDLLFKPRLQRLHLKYSAEPSQLNFICRGVGKHCRELKCLFLEVAERSQDYVAKMIRRLHRLESLSLIVQQGLSSLEALTLLDALPITVKALRIWHIHDFDAISVPYQIQKLSLHLRELSDAILSMLTSNLPLLNEMDLTDDPRETPLPQHDLSNVGIQQVTRCRYLRRLSLVRGGPSIIWRRSQVTFKLVNDIGLLMMAQNCENLESIRLGRFSQVTDTGLKSILESCTRLHTFELIQMKQISDLTFHDVPALACSLITVSLPAANQITSDAISKLSFCERLRFLNLAFCRSVGDQCLRGLSSLSKLSMLDLSGADITDFGLFSLSRGCMPLVSLSLRSCKRLTHNGISSLTQGFLPATLEALDLSNLPAVTDHTIVALVNSDMHIADLRLRDCHSLTTSTLAALASMHHGGNCFGGSLRVLDLWNDKGMTSDSLGWFRRPYFPRLRWLGLPQHLVFGMNSELFTALVTDRCSIDMSTTGYDAGFGYNALSAMHDKHWDGGGHGEPGGYGILHDDRVCALCAYS